MKKFLFAGVLALAATAFSQNPAPQQQPAQPGQTGEQPGVKTIKDPAEYNAYMSAIGMSDPNQKASALEQFVQQYPGTIVKEEALAAAMSAYQQAGNLQKSGQIASQVLQGNPNHVPALALQTYVKRQGGALAEAGQLAQRGLAALPNFKPEGVDAATLEKQRAGLSAIFNGAAGQAALAANDYPTAQKFLTEAVNANPDNVQDVYPLAIAILSQKGAPADVRRTGLWYIARACSLVQQNPQAAQQICNYGKNATQRFTNDPAKWDAVLNAARTQPNPPAEIAQLLPEYVPPSPADQAQEMLAKTPVKDMSFGEWIFILTSGHQPSADAVWSEIQNKGLRFQGKIIESSAESVSMAVTADGIEANVPEVKVNMLEPFRTPPNPGSDFQMQAVPVSYTLNPFQITMEQGVPFGASASKAKTKTKAKPKTKAKRRA